MNLETLQVYSSAFWLSFAVVSVGVGLVLFRKWSHDRALEREEDIAFRKMELDMRRREIEQGPAQTNVKVEAPAPAPAPAQEIAGSGGYIVIDMPDDQKRMFHDVLKGFEEFAGLKGYSISFSLDGSIPDKVAFKFTILDQGITVSTQSVKEDLKEYIRRVQEGDDLADMPILIAEERHAGLLLAMRNRISFLQHTYAAQKNALDFYERILKDGGRNVGIAPAQNFYLQGAGSMSARNYTAIGSERVVQGDNNDTDQSIHIAESFNEKKQQLDNLDALIASLTSAHPTPTETSKKAVVNLEKVKDELTTEAKPDGTRIKKWLETARDSIKALALGKDVVELATKTFDGFELPF